MTVCFRGKKSTSKRSNKVKIDVYLEIIQTICQTQHHAQAIVFPGGYFFLDRHVGHLNYTERKQAIASSSIGSAINKGCSLLSASLRSPPMVIVGIDSAKKPRHGYTSDNGDQLCVAFHKTEIKGIGRKVFPDDYELYDYVTYADDFRRSDRIITLPDGRRAVLCACYDMFGIAESHNRATKRTRNIKYIGEGNDIIAATGEEGFAEVRARLVREWASMLKREKVSVGLAAIHQFDRPGLDKYWQRHGIGVASAALRGGLALGAAHFIERLPPHDKSTLAAVNVPRYHLNDGTFRRHYAIQPIHSMHVETSHGSALIRVYSS